MHNGVRLKLVKSAMTLQTGMKRYNSLGNSDVMIDVKLSVFWWLMVVESRVVERLVSRQ